MDRVIELHGLKSKNAKAKNSAHDCVDRAILTDAFEPEFRI